MLTPALFATLALSAIVVDGSSSCPTPEAVSEALREAQVEGDHRVALRAGSSTVAVQLFDGSGQLLGERALVRDGSCAEMAETAAVLVVAWTIEMPAVALPPVEPPPPVGDEPGGEPKRLEGPPAAPPAPPPAPPLEEELISTTLPLPPTPIRAIHERGARHEVAVAASLPAGPRYTQAAGVRAAYNYWFLNGLALEGSVHVLAAQGLNGLGQNVSQAFPESSPPLTDLYAPQLNFGVNGIVSLARGPMQVLGFVDGPSFELYFAGGVGAGLTRREIPEIIIGPGPGADDARWAPTFSLGGGIKLFLFREAAAIEIDFRDIGYPEPRPDFDGFTHNLQVHMGVRVSIEPRSWREGLLDGRPNESRENSFTLTPMIGSTFLDSFTVARSLTMTATYEVLDFVAIEAIGGYFFSSENAFTKEMLEEGKLTPDLAKLTQLRFAVGGGLRLNVLRGRLSSLGIPFLGDGTFYVAGGMAYGQTRVQCTPGMRLDPERFGPDAVCPAISGDIPVDELVFVYEPNRPTLVGHLGAGLQLSLAKQFALTFEIRDFVFSTEVVRPDSPMTDTSGTRNVVTGQFGFSLIL